MSGPRFADELMEASAAIDWEFGEAFALTPMAAAADVNAAPSPDLARVPVTFLATFFDPEDKPKMPNAYDTRQDRRPGVETASPRIEVSPSSAAAVLQTYGVALAIRVPDHVTRQSDGAVYSAKPAYVSATGIVHVRLNRVS